MWAATRRGANFGDVGAEDARQRILDLGRHPRVRCQQPRLCPEVGVLQRPKVVACHLGKKAPLKILRRVLDRTSEPLEHFVLAL
eukprot:10574737-Alexandrium_andersonii.AAC.1